MSHRILFLAMFSRFCLVIWGLFSGFRASYLWFG